MKFCESDIPPAGAMPLTEAYSKTMECPICKRTDMLNVLSGIIRILPAKQHLNRAIFELNTRPVFRSHWTVPGPEELERKLHEQLRTPRRVFLIGPCQNRVAQGSGHWVLRLKSNPCLSDSFEIRPVHDLEHRLPIAESHERVPSSGIDIS
jgi:hypothetical protein